MGFACRRFRDSGAILATLRRASLSGPALLLGLSLGLSLGQSHAHAQARAQDPAQAAITSSQALRALQELVPAGERSAVMVLGTFHFRELGAQFKPSQVRAVIDALARFKPEVIAIETLGGVRIRELLALSGPGRLEAELVDDFARTHRELASQAQAELKLADDVQARQALAALPREASTPSRLLHLLAALDYGSGLLQWARHGQEPELRAALPAALSSRLDALLRSPNEIAQLAVPLALQAGLQRLEAIDDFEDLESIQPIFAPLQKALKADAGAQAYLTRTRAAHQQQREQAVAQDTLLPYLLHLNRPATVAADVGEQWGQFLRTRLDSRIDRARLALWEERNLKISAKLRALTARHPGRRVLVIYGAAHKPFIEANLSLAADVQLVSPLEVLEAQAQP